MLYLGDFGRLTTTPPTTPSEKRTFRFDPHDPTPTIGGPVLHPKAGPQDNRSIEQREDVLIFETEPLQEPLEIIGSPSVTLHVDSSTQFTDFFARLCDVTTDQRSLSVTDNLLRIELDPNRKTPHEITIRLLPTAWRFKTGHRIRLQIAGGAHPRWNRNPGTNQPALDATTLLPASQTVFYGTQHLSKLTLPTAT